MSKGDSVLFGIFKKGKDKIIDETCVLSKIVRDSIVHKYRKINKYNQENFDSKIEYDDIEPGMDIE